jgi:hypothetical protein
MQSVAGKLFTPFYRSAGMIFLVAVGVLIAPVFHLPACLLHRARRR